MADAEHISIDGTVYDVKPSGTYVTGVKGDAETTYRSGNVNITKANVGLGNVPNVTTNNQAPTFTQASSRANIASGETLTTIFGKIMKFFADLKTVAFTNSYNDLDDKPTIPTVNNATLTIQKNGTNVETFTANASANKTANITVPTKVSELTNDKGYTTNKGTVTSVKVGSTSYSPSSGVVSLPAYPTVNNATLTIQKNGTTVKTFTANASSAVTANITVPTKVSELTNDSGFVTNATLKSGTLSPNKTLYVVSDIQGLGLITFIQGPPLASNATANFTSIRLLKNGTWYTLTLSTIKVRNYGNTVLGFNEPSGWTYDSGKSYTVELTGTITYT
jgi:hypothetical protein